MRNFLFAVLFPFTLAAQVELPDSTTAAKFGVKKLVVLRCEEGRPADTELVYRFDPYCKTDHGWRREGAVTFKVQPVPDSMKIVVKNEEGRVTFEGRKFPRKNPREKGVIDTAGTFYFYDANGRLVKDEGWNNRTGTAHTTTYTYDAAGHLTVETIIPTHPISIDKTELHYNATGQLVSVIKWWAWFPKEEGDVPPDPDTRTSKIVYTYDANGLITEAFAEDPTHNSFCIVQDGRTPVDKVVFRYIYFY